MNANEHKSQRSAAWMTNSALNQLIVSVKHCARAPRLVLFVSICVHSWFFILNGNGLEAGCTIK